MRKAPTSVKQWASIAKISHRILDHSASRKPVVLGFSVRSVSPSRPPGVPYLSVFGLRLLELALRFPFGERAISDFDSFSLVCYGRSVAPGFILSLLCVLVTLGERLSERLLFAYSSKQALTNINTITCHHIGALNAHEPPCK